MTTDQPPPVPSSIPWHQGPALGGELPDPQRAIFFHSGQDGLGVSFAAVHPFRRRYICRNTDVDAAVITYWCYADELIVPTPAQDQDQKED
jgi:hypothetical protein